MIMRPLFALACLSAALLLSGAALAKPNLNKGPLYVAESERVVQGGRATLIALATPEIGATIELGRVAETSSSGSIGNYYWSAGPFNEAPALAMLAIREAEYKVVPLRKALNGFDGAKLTLDAVRSGIAQASWLHPNPLEVQDHPRTLNPLDFVDAAPTPQTAVITTGYYLSPDCTQIEARTEFRLLRKIKKSVSVAAFQTAISVVRLTKPSLEPNANVRQWSANDGALARRAIAAASARMEKLIPRMLTLTAGEVAAWSTKDIAKVQAAGRYGPVVEREPDGPGSVTLWSGGLVSVQQLPAQ